MKYEVLSGLPPYGEMYFPISPDGSFFYSEGMPVRFYRKDGTSWVGNFQPGFGHLDLVHQFENLKEILVVAGGQCYIIDPESSVVGHVFGASYDKGFGMKDGRLVLQDLTGLTIVERDASYWHSQRIAIDGIRDIALNGSNACGSAYLGGSSDKDWKYFCFNIDTKELTYHSDLR